MTGLKFYSLKALHEKMMEKECEGQFESRESHIVFPKPVLENTIAHMLQKLFCNCSKNSGKQYIFTQNLLNNN